MPGIGIGISRFLKRATTSPRVVGLTMFSATSPFPELYYNFNAGVTNSLDDSPTYEVVATTDPTFHAGEPITVHVPAKFEIMTPDAVWHNSDFAHILGDGTGSNPSALLKCRVRSGQAVGTFSNDFKADHAQLPVNYTVFSVTGRVKSAVHATTIAWQNALAGTKPSGKLLFYLDDMISGVDSDGDLTEMDYFHMVRGMETDEQRLKPLKSTAGVDADLIGSGAAPAVFDRTGIMVTAATQKTIRFKWRPITNGVKATQNNNTMFCTYSAAAFTLNGILCGVDTPVSWKIAKNAGGTFNATRSWTNSLAVAGGANLAGYVAVYRTSSTAQSMFSNGVVVNGASSTSAAISDFYPRMPGGTPGADTGDSTSPHLQPTLHCFGVGSSSINNTDVRARLNTYYTGLGLSTT